MDGHLTVDWEKIRAQFSLSKGWIHLAQMYMTSHTKKIQDSIEFHRKALDENPVLYLKANHGANNRAVAKAAAEYLECASGEIALTDSTTMGLGILHHGLILNPGDEILTTNHCHYASITSIEAAARRSNARVKKIDLYQESATTKAEEIIDNLKRAIQPQTRFVIITYVQSSTGVKLPIQQIAAAIKKLNVSRNPSNRIYLSVDAVHAFGIENFTMKELGCDFLTAGTHKWLFGPRGTGILYGKEDAWDVVDPIIPPYSIVYNQWRNEAIPDSINFFQKITPGGFHSFEYRWALKEAFQYHLEIGKDKIQTRTHYLNSLLKEGMANIPHIKVHTPFSNELSSGITCFEVDGLTPKEVIQKLRVAKIIGSTTPYRQVFARLTPSILNTEEDIYKCIGVLENICS